MALSDLHLGQRLELESARRVIGIHLHRFAVYQIPFLKVNTSQVSIPTVAVHSVS
jgi:hypothetical protein